MFINNASIGVYENRQLLGMIFFPFIENLKLMSDDGVKQLLIKGAEMVQEIGSREKVKSALSVAHAHKFDRDIAETFIVNTYLAAEGMGTLHGFGYAQGERKEGGAMRVTGPTILNPEKHSLRKVDDF